MPSSSPLGRLLPLRWLAVAAAFGGSAGMALAQDAGVAPQGGRSNELTFGIGASETLLASVRPGGSRVDEAVTQITPTVRWSSYSGRLRGSLNYSAGLRHYAGNNDARTDKNTVDHSLTASARAELVERAAFVDINGSIGQQAISALDSAANASSFQPNSNRSEVYSVSVSPYVVGSLAGLATYELRYALNASDGSDESFSRRTSDTLSLVLRGQSAGIFGWGAQVSASKTDFGDRGQNRNDRANLDLTIRPDVDWRFVVSGGQERTNVGTVAARSYANWGLSGSWTPSPRTRVDFGTERRYFGDAHRLAIEYRTQRTVFRYSDVRDVNNGNQQGGIGQPVTLFELFFAQFASIQPDRIQREQLVLQYLASIGRDPNEVLFADVVNRGVTVQRRRDLSAAWIGIRTTVTVQAFANDNRLLSGPNTGSTVGGSGRQQGVNVSASYRLTPQTALSAGLTESRTPVAGGLGTNQKTASLGLSSQLGRRTSAALSGRYSVVDGGTDPYREASVTASISLRF